MKKTRLIALLMIMVMACSLCACKKSGKQELTTRLKKDATVKDALDNIMKNAKVSDFQQGISMDTIQYMYLNLDMEIVEDASGIYINDQKVDEITIIKAKDGKVADVKSAFKQRISDQLEVSKQYDEKQYKRLSNKDNYVIKSYGNFVILSIAEDNKGVIKAFEESVTEY